MIIDENKDYEVEYYSYADVEYKEPILISEKTKEEVKEPYRHFINRIKSENKELLTEFNTTISNLTVFNENFQTMYNYVHNPEAKVTNLNQVMDFDAISKDGLAAVTFVDNKSGAIILIESDMFDEEKLNIISIFLERIIEEKILN